jgi:transposase-like protein
MGRISRINEPRTVKQILCALSSGVSVEIAAQSVGISRSTLFGWLQLGREARVLSEQGVKVLPVQQKYLDFLDSSEREFAISIANAVARISRASEKGDWRAAVWWLSKMDPINFGKPNPKQFAVDEWGAREQVQSPSVSIEELERKIEQILMQRSER